MIERIFEDRRNQNRGTTHATEITTGSGGKIRGSMIHAFEDASHDHGGLAEIHRGTINQIPVDDDTVDVVFSRDTMPSRCGAGAAGAGSRRRQGIRYGSFGGSSSSSRLWTRRGSSRRTFARDGGKMGHKGHYTMREEE